MQFELNELKWVNEYVDLYRAQTLRTPNALDAPVTREQVRLKWHTHVSELSAGKRFLISVCQAF